MAQMEVGSVDTPQRALRRKWWLLTNTKAYEEGAYVYHDLRRSQQEGIERNLPRFRVLELFPAKCRDEPLQGRLVVEDLHDRRMSNGAAYESLSYCWGDVKNKQGKLFLEGSWLGIGENLDAALRQSRDKKWTRRLWVDAICIDQSDEEERSEQVALMSLLYRSASRVLVWLGEDTELEDGRITIDFLKWLANREKVSICPSTRGSMQQHHPSWSDMDYLEKCFDVWRSETQHHKSLGLLQLRLFFQRPYWSRRWIIQEIAVADSVVLWCGNHSISGATFARAAPYISAQDSGLGPLEPFRRLIRLDTSGGRTRGRLIQAPITSWRTGGQPKDYSPALDFLITMELFSDFKCSDPRDRIVALQGTTLFAKGFYQVTYSHSVEMEYTRFAHGLLNSEEGRKKQWVLKALLTSAARRCRMGQESTTLPSWVPDWRVRTQNTRISFLPAHHPGTVQVDVLTPVHGKTAIEANMTTSTRLHLQIKDVYFRKSYVETEDYIDLEDGDCLMQLSDLDKDQIATEKLEGNATTIILRPDARSSNSWKIIGAVIEDDQSFGGASSVSALDASKFLHGVDFYVE